MALQGPSDCPAGTVPDGSVTFMYKNGTATMYYCLVGVSYGGSSVSGGAYFPGYCLAPPNPVTGQSNCGGSGSRCSVSSIGNNSCYRADQVAIYNGPPAQSVPCPSNDGANSLPVGATVGYANTGSGQQARSVKDINAIYGYSSVNITNGHTYYTNLVTIGWVYEDDNGAFWFQQNANISWTYSLGVGITVGRIISGSFAINSPPGKAAVSIGSSPGTIGAHETASPCFSQGAQFFSGEILA